ncbi:MAG: phosphoenolpyruvate--protein phosphotransferase [Deltaproteobacteria bacterium]|nr:MAG: phosphoenolpyruvate--protein phosphotransferase [Deltaproteobacteria bacterium]
MPRQATHQIGITTLEDISALILQSHDLDETLRNIVTLVAKRMRSDVCSIYLLDADNETLRLQASKGLSRKAVGKVTLRIGEGLTGMAAQKRHAIAIEEPQEHPSYRYFKETGEERFHSFLGIPLFDRDNPLGVIVLQTKTPRQFSKEEISALSTIAFQITSIVVNARLLDSIRQHEEESQRVSQALAQAQQTLTDTEKTTETSPQHVLTGHVAYPGVAIGPAAILEERLGFSDILHEEEVDIDAELKNLESALEKTCIQTIFLEKRVAERLSESDAAIFHTHLMILEDRSFIRKLQTEISNGHCAAYALEKIVADYIEVFRKMEDPYLRERATDMEDIGRRILANLVGDTSGHTLHLKHPGILVARQILPSDMATLDNEQILAIITEAGEKNAHAVIMAKSMGIPSIVAVNGALKHIAPEDNLIVDANTGRIYINPLDSVKDEYQRLQLDQTRELCRLEEYRDQPAMTSDGERIILRANIGLISDINVAMRFGAEGVGLYRTEFPYMARGDFPGRNDQYELYSRVVREFNGQPVTIRTLDIGGDKALPYFSLPKEDNPFMGWRSVRVSLDNRDIFRTQIEAILMAGCHGPVKLLFPMISSLDEIRACLDVVEEARKNLQKEGVNYSDKVPVGVMIEVPAAVRLVPKLANEVDFFALGTNDLVQYLLAADRNNPLVSKYYDPLHPAVLQVLYEVTDAAISKGKGVSLCGEMATDPATLLLLIGMGLREFSMPAPFIPRIKAFLKGVSMEMACRHYTEIHRMDSSTQIRGYLDKVLSEIEMGD